MGMMDGVTAIVIGGHSGLGEAITRRFAAEGAHVVVAARRTELIEEVAKGVDGTAFTFDITDDAQVKALVDLTVAERGGVQVAVNCAGFQQSTPLRDLTPEKMKVMLDVQLTGALYALRHCCNAMAAGGGGAFLTISSLTAHNPSIGHIAYASAKAGMEYATQIAAVEYGKERVRVNAVASALIETPMTAPIFENEVAIQAVREMTPLGYMGSPDDIAKAALFLCSDLGSYVTGQTLCVDGGASLLALPTPQMYLDVAARLRGSG
jgi:NAD(P)-dependent dehydrogenase (short-subunit alcohol dehydrogenase family)